MKLQNDTTYLKHTKQTPKIKMRQTFIEKRYPLNPADIFTVQAAQKYSNLDQSNRKCCHSRNGLKKPRVEPSYSKGVFWPQDSAIKKLDV